MGPIYLMDYSLIHYLVGSMVALCGIFFWGMMYNFCLRYAGLIRAAKKFPGPPTIPLLGNSWEFVKNIGESFNVMIRLSKEYPIGRLWLGPRLLIAVTRPEHIEIVMKSHETSKKSFVHDFMEPMVVNSLINGHGPKMRAHRKLLVPLINGEYLTKYMETFNNQTRRCVNNLLIKMKKNEFDIYDEAQYCMADMAFETLFGIPGVGQSHGDLTIPHAVDTYLETLYQRSITPWLHPFFFFILSKHGKASKNATATVHKFIKNLVQEKKKLHTALVHGEPGVHKPKPSILDLWMESVIETNAMNDQEILYDTITLFAGFYDTVLGVFAFTMLMLAMHHDIQEKVREEVISVMGSDEDIKEENIGKLNYIKMVIKETIRLFPVGPIMMREVIDDLEMDEYTLPKGSVVAMFPVITHKSKEYWEDPEKFNPERFSPENSKNRHPFAYVPFSGGPRRCPGTKFAITCLKVMIAQFIRQCRLTTNMKLESLELKMHISVRSLHGYKVSIEKIDTSSFG